LALQLRDALQPPQSVFVYSKAQEHLAGRDGVEAFRTVFRERASLIVILYAPPWGETAWTRVEKTAIEEFAMEAGWEHLIFVRLKDDQPVPKWVPKPHLYLDLTTFTLQDLVGAIKLRLAELGIEAKPISPAERAAAQAKRRAFDAETIQLLGALPNDYNITVEGLTKAIEKVAKAVANETGWRVGAGPAAVLGGFIVTAEGQTIQLVSMRKYTNTVDDAYLELREFDCGLTVAQPGQRYFLVKSPEPVRSRRIPIRRLPELGWCWEIDGRTLSIESAASTIMHVLLDRIDGEATPRGPGMERDEPWDSIDPPDE